MMSIVKKTVYALSLVVASAALVAPALAQEDRLREQLDDARNRIQQLQAERAALQTRIRALEADLESSETRAQAMQSSVERSRGQIEELNEAVAQRTNLAANAQAQINAARRQATEARQAYAQLLEQTTAIQARFESQQAIIALAEEKNRALVETGKSILADYEEQTFSGRLLAREPITQLYKVRLENEFQSFRDQIMDLRFVPEAARQEIDLKAREAAAEAAPGAEAQ